MNLDDLDTMIMQADPAQDISISSAFSAEAQAAYLEIASQSNRRSQSKRQLVLIAGAVSTVAAVMIVLIVSVVPGPSGPESAAATVLADAAAKSSEQAVQLKPGQYLYTETQSLYQLTLYRPNGRSLVRKTVAARFTQTNQVWTDAKGAGRILQTDSPLQFSSRKDQMEWQSSPVGQHVYQSLLNEAETDSETRPSEALVDLSRLPTAPRPLERILARGDRQTNIENIPSGPGAVFERAAALLLGPDFGMTPALTSGLFHVLAGASGARLIGDITTHDGRRGEAVTISNTASGSVSEVIVDPRSGTLLEVRFPLPDRTIESGGTRTCVGPSLGRVVCTQESVQGVLSPIWTDLVSSGSVSSVEATP